ncbi:hypothetical protein QLX08_005205 [Tetragonisca angustula]|uniref:Uncharacterized protein n=1 Tax=Tetragonisca angustula TaxID=166442 RepID=A0AAW0ZZ92_9HYME
MENVSFLLRDFAGRARGKSRGEKVEERGASVFELKETNATSSSCPEAGPNVPIIREKRTETGSTTGRAYT